MGSLGGHVIPGVFFIIHGIWWCFLSMWYHLTSKSSALKPSGESRAKKDKYPPSFFEYKRDCNLGRKAWLPLPCTRIPLEPIIKTILPALGMIVELFFVYKPDESGKSRLSVELYRVRDNNGQLNDLSKLHHITMYGSFVLSGIVDLVSICAKFPRPTSMIFFSLAFGVEGILFYLHTLGRDALNVQIHLLLVYSIFACVIFAALRTFRANNLIINLGLGSSILLQGTWFIQAGYFLFGGFLEHQKQEVRDAENHVNSHMEGHKYTMFIAANFTWHLLFIALSQLLIWGFLSVCFRNKLLQKRISKRRNLTVELQQTWKDTTEECNRLIAEESTGSVENRLEMQKEMTGGVENGIEMQKVAETHA